MQCHNWQHFVAILLTFTSIGRNYDHHSYHSDSSHTQPRRPAVTRREETHHSSREFLSRVHSQRSTSDHQPQESEYFTSDRASYSGSRHSVSYTSENGSTQLEDQSQEITSQSFYFHLEHIPYNGLRLPHYEKYITIEEDPKDEPFTNSPVVQYATKMPATENGIQASSNEQYLLQTYSPTTEIWARQESRDERIRLGLPGGQETTMSSFDLV